MSKRKSSKTINTEESATIESKKRFNKKIIFGEFKSWLLLIFIAIIAGYAFVTFMFQTVTVIGPSMSSTLEDGDVVIVNKIVYKLNDIERYDIVAYKSVNSEGYYDIKRVYGLPEETVSIKGGKVLINGEELSDMPISENILTPGIAQNDIVLGKDEYFVLGDNINNSEDSRFSNIGNITKSEIKGKVSYIFSPKGHKGKVE